MTAKERYIKNCMQIENCTREIAEKYYELKLELESKDFTPERGAQIFNEQEALQQGNTETTTVYTTYAPSTDMTFIMRDTYKGEECIMTECIGWYYGEPEEGATEYYVGRLTAEY